MIILIPIIVVLVIAFIVWWVTMKNKPKGEQENTHLAERAAEILTSLPKKYQTVYTEPKSTPKDSSQSTASDNLPHSDQEIESNRTAPQEDELPYDMKEKNTIEDDITAKGIAREYMGGESAEKVIDEAEPHHQVIRHLQSESNESGPKKKFHEGAAKTPNIEEKITNEMFTESMTEGDIEPDDQGRIYIGGESAERTIEDPSESQDDHDADSSKSADT